MTAQGIGIFTIEFEDPSRLESGLPPRTLPGNVSFRYPITNNIQTLSPKNGDKNDDPAGVLFVPELLTYDCMVEEEEKHVPANTTRLRNLPERHKYDLIAIAPWFSGQCVLEYFESARSADVRAFLVYQPGTTNSMPPPMNDISWAIGDGGRWKTDNMFPTYALSSMSGAIVVKQMGLYSGNVSEVPYSTNLTSMLNSTDYVRLCATVDIESENKLPSLWVFLVIVLGLLLLAIIGTSSFMHVVQKRRREDLRRRVISGEVNLESVGIKRLNVPQDYLNKLPLYTYSGPEGADLEKSIPQTPTPPLVDSPRRSSAPASTSPPGGPAWSFSQPTCPICLDDYVPGETQVRELPCRHIFHPDCVDTFLLHNSSLCPMCKKSVMPTGYCPPRITNVMVRRERMINRMQNRDTRSRAGTQPPGSPEQPPESRIRSLGRRIGGAITGRRVFSAPERAPSPPRDIEMAVPSPDPPMMTTATTVSSTPPVPSPAAVEATPSPAPMPVCSEQTSPQNRREWARERALTLLGDRHVPATGEEEVNEANVSRWKRGVRKVFPGFR